MPTTLDIISGLAKSLYENDLYRNITGYTKSELELRISDGIKQGLLPEPYCYTVAEIHPYNSKFNMVKNNETIEWRNFGKPAGRFIRGGT